MRFGLIFDDKHTFYEKIIAVDESIMLENDTK
jgi:hypothetical protein